MTTITGCLCFLYYDAASGEITYCNGNVDHPRAETPGFNPDALVFKELTVIGALGVDAPVYQRALELLASDRYPFRDLPREVVNIEHAGAMLASMAGESDSVPPIHAVLTP